MHLGKISQAAGCRMDQLGQQKSQANCVFRARSELISGQRRDWGDKVVGLEEYLSGNKELGDR